MTNESGLQEFATALTDEQILEIADSVGIVGTHHDLTKFARAVIAKVQTVPTVSA